MPSLSILNTSAGCAHLQARRNYPEYKFDEEARILLGLV